MEMNRTFASRIKAGDKTRVGSVTWEATRVERQGQYVRVTWRNWAGQERTQRMTWATRVRVEG
jgi:hypothetical protein